MYKKREIIKKIREELKDGNKLAIAISKTALKSKRTFYNWMEANPRLKNLIKRAEELCDDKRNLIVEDKFFDRFLNNIATPTDFIFYLTNRMPERWADRRAVVHSGEIKGKGAETKIFNVINNKSDKEINDLITSGNSRKTEI